MHDLFVTSKLKIVRTSVLGKKVFFAVDQPRDSIQSHHLKGRFYEPDELLIMSRVFPKGGRFLDIGANVGNHSVFFGTVMNAAAILPIEVNPRIIEVLKTNILLNRLDDVCDISHLGKGLHSERVESASINFRERNIGGGKISLDDGDLTLIKGDDILTTGFDFVKIDVEGMELDVLQGMADFVGEYRPKMFIEVSNSNIEAFFDWMKQNSYVAIDEFRRYKVNCNYLIVPAETV